MGMSIKQFVGEPDCGGTMSHEEKFGKVVEAIGLGTCIRYLPASKEQIAQALANGDEHLNSISLNRWDSKHPSFKREFVRVGITVISLSDTVCTLKHAAKLYAER